MAFKINLPESPGLEDFKKAKSSLVKQYVTRSAGSKSKAEYQFGMKITDSKYEIDRMFKQTMSMLFNACKFETGEDLLSKDQCRELEE
tara:strand:- start:161 stop:424 length:264 start_codon:yes stop_codon:yes gene_type:complete